ncbi:MAG: alpha-amylase [Lewinellaceae bacterium]|nr:alpha-amylase [Lewinellaceae bacterium]
MKNHALFFLLSAILAASCSPAPPVPEKVEEPISFPEKIASATIYEANIRQHTPEGTINAFTEGLPRLKELGVQMLWIMPIQPIGIKNRKGPLGSYYSIQDYTTVNEEFGTFEDFNNLVDKAHELGLYVILDWVPNHTAWDHPWVTAHPEYYAQDSLGNIMHEADWTDIALLDHTNPATRTAMIEAMKFWVDSTAIDGFRCDHAGHDIPLYFWEEATDSLDAIRDLFWLAEWDEARMHLEFDATYAWGLMHLAGEVAKGKANADSLHHWIMGDLKEFGHKPFRMTIITNHDENAWQGTVFERYGEGHKAFATFIFTAYGIPMLYSGQEVGLDKRLRFFAKDTIDWSDPRGLQPFYKKLIALKVDNPALWAGQYGAMPERINADPDIYAFKRVKGKNMVIGILNLSEEPQTFHLKDATVSGSYRDYFTNQQYELSVEQPVGLEPWQYLVFVGK